MPVVNANVAIAVAQHNIPLFSPTLWAVSIDLFSMQPTTAGKQSISITAQSSLTATGTTSVTGVASTTTTSSLTLGVPTLVQQPVSLSSEILDYTQRVVPKITAEWATSKYMDNLIITATDDGTTSTDVPCANKYFTPSQAANGWNASTFKWAVVSAITNNGDVIRCDDGFVTMESLDAVQAQLEHGWWSKSLSNGAGTLATPQVVQFEFDQRKANYIRVTTSDVYGPINQYKVYYKNTSNIWIQVGSTHTMSGTQVEHDLGSVIDIKGVKVEVLSTLYPLDSARIQELEPVYRTDISASDVVSLDVKKVKESYDTTVPMGALAANTFDLTLNNIDLTYNTNSGSLSLYLVKDVSFDVSLGWDTGSGIIYVHQGKFYAEDTWQEDGDSMTVSVSARDYSRFLQEGDQLEYGYLLENKTAGEAISYLALTANVPRNKIIIRDAGHTFPYFFGKDESIWDAMLNVATADIGLFFFDEFENLTYVPQQYIYDHSATINHSLSDSTNIIKGSVSHTIQANKVVVKVQPASTSSTATGQVWRAPDNFSLAATELTTTFGSTDDSFTSSGATDLFFELNGFIKIDSEIIKYSTLTNNVFSGLTRGCFDTIPAGHTSGAKIKQLKELNIDFDTSPVAKVKAPLITVQTFDHKVDVDRYVRTAYSANLIVSASDSVAVGEITVLEGENKVSGFTESFSISGVPISLPEAKDKITEESESDNSAIRRFGKKDLTIENQFIHDQAYARNIAKFLISKFQHSATILNIDILCVPNITMDYIVEITNYDQLAIVNKTYFVIESTIHYDGGCTHQLVLKEVT